MSASTESARPRIADPKLDRLWLEGKDGALGELHRRYRRPLEAVAYRILRNQADAEDVVQRVFLALPGAAYRGSASLWSYLYRAATNGSVNVLRARRRRENAQRELSHQEGLRQAIPSDNPETHVLEGEVMAEVARALEHVKPQHRRVLVLRIVHGLSNTEIARRESIPLATVGTWLRRGREDLRRELGALLHDFGRAER